MEGIVLGERLSTVARWVLPDLVMADIGTDHAYLPCWLVSGGFCPRAVAVDVAAGPYQRARQVVSEQGLTERVSLRLGSGLSVLEAGEAATIVLAGMGGQLICQLLQAERKKAASARRLVLQPQRNQAQVRSWLAGNGWRIVADDLAREDRMWYNIIVAEEGETKLTEAEVLYGPLTPQVSLELRLEWLRFSRDRLRKISGNLARSQGREAGPRRAAVEKELAMAEGLITEVKKC